VKTGGAWLGVGVILVLAARAAYLATQYFAGAVSAPRYQVESACLLWALAGIAVRIARGRRASDNRPAPKRPAGWNVLPWMGASLVLYWPALSVGFLSDDFQLLERASRLDLTAFNAEAFRPVPLGVWALLLRAGAGAPVFHLVNVLAHGVNAYLTTRVVETALSPPWALIAGVIMLTFPAAPEAVVWSAGVFDVSATLFALLALLVARQYGEHPTTRRRLMLFGVVGAAILSKESAIVVPVVLAIDAWTRGERGRALTIDLAILTAVFVLYGAVRIAFASDALSQPITRYSLQRVLFGLFAGLSSPWHAEIAGAWPVIPIAGTLAVIALATLFFVRAQATADRTRFVALCAALVVGPIVPAITIFFVGPNLEGSRFLYLSSVGWAGLLVSLAAAEPEPAMTRSAVTIAFVALLVAIGPVGVRLHMRNWQAAGQLRHQVEHVVASDERVRGCSTVTLEGLPDNVAGAYVFRNGAPEAFARDLGLTVVPGSNGPCAFRWRNGTLERTP
jgi:protein O-mannosyl-transferase